MILAAADCAEGRGPPPPELELAWQARSWGTLPEAGGLRDQRAGELRRLSAALNTYNAVKAFHAAKDAKQWADTRPDQWRIMQYVATLRAKAKGTRTVNG